MSKAKKEGSAPTAPEEGKADPSKPRKVRVRATKVGFYNHSQVRVGSVFYFLYDPASRWPSWMVEVNDDNEPLGESSAAPQSIASEEPKGSSSDDVI